ncbi:MAG: pseudouridine synthase [Methylophilaceae bacterium]
MTTIKISKKPIDSTRPQASKAPVRRTDPSKRDRTVAPKPFVKPQDETPVEHLQSRAAAPTESAPSKASQRNHRFDGRLRNEAPRESSESFSSPTPRPSLDDTGRDTPRRGGKMRDGFEVGHFNNDRTTNPMFSPKPLPSNPDFPRLSKRMAELGFCSRREADEWISNGWVKVDGIVIDELGSRVKMNANIEISKDAEKHQSEVVTIILNKPIGYVSGQAEDGYDPAIVLIHPDNHWKDDPLLHHSQPKEFQRGFLKGLAPAGRLDIDSTGLLVLTQDGRIARHLIGEDSTVEKEYLVRVEGDLSYNDLDRLNHGLSLDGVNLKPAKVSWQNEDQLRFVLREGRKRQIRRMCELVGLKVLGLKRIRIGSVTLGKLPIGEWRYLRPEERF